MNNPYETLGVAKDASVADIKKAYRKLASKHHPDRDSGSHEAMNAINVAYLILSDPEKRQRFDETGSVNKEPTMRDRAMEMVLALANLIIEQAPETMAIVAEINKQIDHHANSFTDELGKAKAQIKKLEKRKKSIKSNGDTMLFDLFVQKIGEHTRKQEHFTQMIEVAKLAKQIVKDGGYEDVLVAADVSGLSGRRAFEEYLIKFT